MIRPVLFGLAIFSSPFVVYALVLLATRSGVFEKSSWPLYTLARLMLIALVLVIASLVGLANFSGTPPGATYVPAHMENGKFVPGTTS